MVAGNLATADVWKAIDLYLGLAYGGPVPSPVRSKLEMLRSMSAEDFYASPIFERDSKTAPSKLSLRLGNKMYPHMKLTIERSPDKNGFLFRADTHDQHVCPAVGSREYQAFCQLMESNQKLAQAIETGWAEMGLPTFKTYLREDLARRAGLAGEKREELPQRGEERRGEKREEGNFDGGLLPFDRLARVVSLLLYHAGAREAEHQ